MPNGLGVGAGIAKGAEAFVNNFMRAKQLEHDEKQQKNAFVVQLLTRQLEDENLPYYERAKILDSIPKLLGIKNMDRNLSEMFGLDKFNKEIVQDPNQPAIKGVEAKAASTYIDPSTANTELAGGINVRGTQGTQDVAAGTTQQGNLSPAQIKRKLSIEYKKAEDEGDIKKAERIAQINFDLQERSYKANGYKITSEGITDQGEYAQVLTNNSGDTKVNRLPKGFKPTKLLIAEANINKPSVFIKEREDYWESQGFSPDKANIKALADANERFKLSQKGKEAYVTSVEQGNAGTRPPTAAGRESNLDRDRAAMLQIQKDIDEATANANASHTAVEDLVASKDDALRRLNEAEAALKAKINAGYDQPKDHAEEARAVAATRKEYNDLQEQIRKASADDLRQKALLSGAQTRLRTFGNQTGANTVSAQVQQAVDKVRANNPDKTKNMSDQEIINYLRAKKIIQ